MLCDDQRDGIGLPPTTVPQVITAHEKQPFSA